MTEQIFKLQRPLNGPGHVLVYNQDKTIFLTLPWPRDKQASFFNGAFKVYAKGVLKDNNFEVLEKVPEQSW